MNNLEPCPFCGEQPAVWEENEEWAAVCNNEDCHMSRVLTRKYPTKDEAIAAWNRRFVCKDGNGDAVFAGDDVFLEKHNKEATIDFNPLLGVRFRTEGGYYDWCNSGNITLIKKEGE